MFGGAFGVTAGLHDEFGEARVIDTPIAEEGFVGAAIGAAWMGERPVVELQFADFITCAFDPIVTVAAKTHWRSGQQIPITIRCPTGGGVRGGPVPRRLARGLVRRHRRAQGRLPRHRRGRLRAAPGRDRRSRPCPLLRAQAALPDASGRGAAERPPHPDRAGGDRAGGHRRDGRHVRLRCHHRARSRRPGRRRRRGRRPSHDLAARRARRSSPRWRRPHASSCCRRPRARPVPPE